MLKMTRGFSAASRLTSLSSKGEGRGPCLSASFGGHVAVRSWPGIYDVGSSVDEVCSCQAVASTRVEVCPRRLCVSYCVCVHVGLLTQSGATPDWIYSKSRSM